MKRRTTTAFLGGLAGSALVVGLRLAIPAAAADHPTVMEPEATPTTSPPVSCCPAPSPSPIVTPPPSTPVCTTFAGDATKVARPGIGAVTVTLAFCDKSLASATSSLTQSNWAANTRALKALDSLALKYYATDVSKIHFSGATLTSKAYQTSLTSALKKTGW